MAHTVQDDTQKMSPELELILRAALPKNAENESRIRTLLDEGVNWNEALACAIHHDLGSFLYERFRNLDKCDLAQDQREAMAELATDMGRIDLAFLGEMLRLCRLFETAKIPAIPRNGPALAWLGNPYLELRNYTDLDFIVSQRYMPQVISLLRASGYSPQFDASEVQAGQQRQIPSRYAFLHDSTYHLLGLRTERNLRDFSHPLNLNEMNSRTVQLEIGGQRVRTFSVEDTLVMLCVQGAKHFWERLSRIVDVANLVIAQPVDWGLAMRIAADLECSRLLLLGLSLAHDVAEVTLPNSVLEEAQRDANVRWLTRMVRKQYSNNTGLSLGGWQRAHFWMRSRDGFWKGLRHISSLGISLQGRDGKTVPLSSLLSPLYMMVWPGKHFRDYRVGLKRRLKPDLSVYVQTPQEIVDFMLDFAEIVPGDVLYDLGCGDGRIVVTAAKEYGIRAVGLDTNPKRIAEAWANARKHGVEDLVEFRLADAKSEDISEATIVTFYLEVSGAQRLAGGLRSRLHPGARIISQSSKIYGWNPDRTATHTSGNGRLTVHYQWTIKRDDKEMPAEKDAVAELRQTHKADG
jgi:SAM-dependent methyltransferase